MLICNRKKLLFSLLLQNVNLYPSNSNLKVALKNLNCLFSLFWYLPLQYKYAMNFFLQQYMGLKHPCCNIHLIFLLKKCIIYTFKLLYIKYILLLYLIQQICQERLTCCNRHILLLNIINFKRNALQGHTKRSNAYVLIIIVFKFNH